LIIGKVPFGMLPWSREHKEEEHPMQIKQRRFGTRQRGQGMTEYIIIVALIAIASITVVSFFGGTVRNQVAGMATELSGQNAGDQIQAAKDAADTAAGDAQIEKNMGSYENTVSE